MNAKAKKPSVMEHLTERIVHPEKPPKPDSELTELLSVRLPFDTFASIEAVRKHLGCTRTDAARMLLDAAWQLLREQVAVKDKEQQKLLDEIKKRLVAERGASSSKVIKAE
jgi:type VI protein secretion system component VasF